VTPLHMAAMAAKLDLAKLLLEHKADFNAMDVFGIPPLVYAKDSKPIADLLRKHGATD